MNVAHWEQVMRAGLALFRVRKLVEDEIAVHFPKVGKVFLRFLCLLAAMSNSQRHTATAS